MPKLYRRRAETFAFRLSQIESNHFGLVSGSRPYAHVTAGQIGPTVAHHAFEQMTKWERNLVRRLRQAIMLELEREK